LGELPYGEGRAHSISTHFVGQCIEDLLQA